VFDWDAANTEHVLAHEVQPDEAEQAIDDPGALAIAANVHAGEQRFGVLGATESGRLLVVIYTWRGDRRRVVTAYPARPRDREVYDQRRL
jgi:uncharacterized DUF497 family protein